MRPTLQYLQNLPEAPFDCIPADKLRFDQIVRNLCLRHESRATRYETTSTVSQKKKRILRRRNQRH